MLVPCKVLKTNNKNISLTVRQHQTTNIFHTYIQTYHTRFIPEEVAEASKIFFRDAPTFYQNHLAMRNTADLTCGKPIAHNADIMHI
jgi:hypothetical protein